MADINDRLERLSRRDELARRARQRTLPASISGVGEDFLEVVEAVAQVVRRHPGMSVMLAPGDGRRGSTVIRVTERRGEAEVAPVTVTGSAEDGVPLPLDAARPAEPLSQAAPLGPAGPLAQPGPWRPPGSDMPTVPRAAPDAVRFEDAPTEIWRWER